MNNVHGAAQSLADYIHTTNLYKYIDNRDTVSTYGMGRLVTILHNIIRESITGTEAKDNLAEVQNILIKHYREQPSVINIFNVD